MEAELTLIVKSPTEQTLDFLNSDLLQLTETKELYKLRTIEIEHLLFDENGTDLTRYDTILKAGNKIWREKTDDGDSCLYVITGPKIYSDDNTSVTITAVEVAIELGKLPPIRSSGFSWIVDERFITEYMGILFEPGTIDGPVTTTTYNGALTPLAIIQEIQNQTGGEFAFRYEYDTTDKIIRRYIDFHNTVGVSHDEVIEIGYNAKNIHREINEESVAIAAAPTGKPSSDSSTFHQSLKAFEELEISKITPIYLYVTKDDAGNTVYGPTANPPYNKPVGQNYVICDEESELVANYQNIQICKVAADELTIIDYEDDFEDGKYTERSSPYRNWTVEKGSATIISSGHIEGSYSLRHTGNGNTEHSNRMTFADTKTEYTLKIKTMLKTQGSKEHTPYLYWYLRYVDYKNWLRLDTYYDSGTNKQIFRLIKSVDSTLTILQKTNWKTGKLSINDPLEFVIKDNGNRITVYEISDDDKILINTNYSCSVASTQKGVGANQDSAAAYDGIQIGPYTPAYKTEYPQIETFETSEENKYNIYWECVDVIRQHLQPDVTITADIIDLAKLEGATPEYYNCGDTVLIRLPGRTDVVQCRITKTVKNPRRPENDSIEISTYKTTFMQEFFQNYFKSVDSIQIE